jgi:hypothetical protein
MAQDPRRPGLSSQAAGLRAAPGAAPRSEGRLAGTASLRRAASSRMRCAAGRGCAQDGSSAWDALRRGERSLRPPAGSLRPGERTPCPAERRLSPGTRLCWWGAAAPRGGDPVPQQRLRPGEGIPCSAEAAPREGDPLPRRGEAAPWEGDPVPQQRLRPGKGIPCPAEGRLRPGT